MLPLFLPLPPSSHTHTHTQTHAHTHTHKHTHTHTRTHIYHHLQVLRGFISSEHASPALAAKVGERPGERPDCIHDDSFKKQKKRREKVFNQTSFVVWNKLRHFPSDWSHSAWDEIPCNIINWQLDWPHVGIWNAHAKDQNQQQTLSFTFNQSKKAFQKLRRCLDRYVSCCFIVSTQSWLDRYNLLVHWQIHNFCTKNEAKRLTHTEECAGCGLGWQSWFHSHFASPMPWAMLNCHSLVPRMHGDTFWKIHIMQMHLITTMKVSLSWERCNGLWVILILWKPLWQGWFEQCNWTADLTFIYFWIISSD